jgi:predicted transposase YbfD/YdcC
MTIGFVLGDLHFLPKLEATWADWLAHHLPPDQVQKYFHKKINTKFEIRN